MAIYDIKQTRQPPYEGKSAIFWLKDHLFSSYFNTFLTLIALWLLYTIIPPLVNFLIIDATFTGGRDEITSDGARWIFIIEKFNQFMYGFYPLEETYRPNIALLVSFAFIMILFYVKSVKIKLISAALYPLILFVLIYGGFSLPVITTDKWGGLMLTIVVSIITLIVSFPIGVLLALGRQSNMPAIQYFCVGFVEFVRGVPLITILFMASVILPLFFEDGMSVDKLLRAIIGMILFQSAYLAEVVRGGLQAIPKGQYEATHSLGLSYWQAMIFIILPQALKISIPNIVSISISLLKDTTLLLIIGLFDILAMVNLTTSDTNWLGFELEGYIFVAAVYWVMCFTMSQYAYYLENKFNTDKRK